MLQVWLLKKIAEAASPQLLEEVIEAATSPIAKAWVVEQLRELADTTPNYYVKALIRGLARLVADDCPEEKKKLAGGGGV